MKTLTIAALITALAVPVALDASAQQRQTDQPGQPGVQRPQQDMQRERDRDRDRDQQRQTWRAPEGVYASDRLIGTKVRSSDGQDLGEIDQLLVNASDGKVSHAVVGRGGFAGVGETKLVVEWSDLQIRRQQDRLVATIDQAKLAQAPRYEEKELQPAASPGRPQQQEKR